MGEGWRYRMSLLVWDENMLVQCCSLLDNILLHDSVADPWFWKFVPIHDCQRSI